jgi:hypothetical protein
VMGLDDLEARAEELDAKATDPKLEIRTEGCTHGGARTVVEWLDSSGLISVPRTEASLVRITELAVDGAVVHREETSVSEAVGRIL